MALKRISLFTIIGIVVFFAAWYSIYPKLNPAAKTTSVASIIKPTKSLNAFSVTDFNGKPFNEKSLRGHWSLLFFGYPNCPDICPQTLAIMRDTWNLYAGSPPARFIFANIDQEPIENSTLKAFLQGYHPEFLGINASRTDMDKLSTQLGVFYKPDQKIFDHTASIALIDPQGRLAAVFTPPFTAEEIAADLDLLTN